MELRLNDHTQIRFEWLRDSTLYVSFLTPTNTHEGHGMATLGTLVLTGQALREFIDAMQTPPKQAA